MEPFKITCVTCLARLSVRNEKLIGQIIACPKCGSMVQVAAPARGDAAASALGAAGASSIVVTQASLQSPMHETAGADALLRGAFEELDHLSAALAPRAAKPRTAAAAQAGPAAPGTVAASPAPTVAGFGAAKIAGIAVASALAGSALVAGVLVLLGSGNATDVAPTVRLPSAELPAAAAQPQDGVESASAAASHDEQVAPANSGVAPQSDPGRPTPTTLEGQVAEPAAGALAATPEGAANNAAVAASAQENANPPAATATATAAAPAPGPRLRIDPLDLDPEGMDIEMLLHGPSAETLAGADAERAPPPAESAAAPAADPPPDAPAAARRDPVPRGADAESPAAPKVLLARRIPSVKIDGVPLCQFLDFVTALSAMPVSVTPDELRLAAISATTAVSVDVKDATIEQLLTTALKPVRLAPNVENGQIVLRRTVTDERRELTYPIGDLVSGDAQQLVGWVQSLVEPQSWQTGGGAGTATVEGASLRLNQTERAGYATILFLERYRAALGLAPQSKYPAALLKAWSNADQTSAPLSAPATFTFSRPTPLGEIFRWWQGELSVAVLIDWPALETQRLAPHTRVIASANQKPWGEAMTAALEPRGLGWRAVDAKTIEITSLDKIRTEPVVELYRLTPASATQGAELLNKVRELGGESGAGRAAYFDDAHRVLLVRQPAAVQQRVAEWLGEAKLIEQPRD